MKLLPDFKTSLLFFLAITCGPVQGLASPPEATVKLKFATTKAKAGQTLQAEVTVYIPNGYHAYSNPATTPDLIPLTISAKQGAELLKADYPKGQIKVFSNIGPEPTGVYEGNLRIPIALKLPGKVNPKHNIILNVLIQMCDDTACYLPQNHTLTETISIETSAHSTNDNEPSQVIEPTTGNTQPEQLPQNSNSEEPTQVQQDHTYPSRAEEKPVGQLEEPAGAFLILLAGAFIAGLSLNLTPCVYPLIPITLSFFSSQVEGQSTGKLSLGGMYALGIALSFGILGAVSSLLGAGFGALAQTPTFNAFMAALLVALALSMFGLYEIRLPMFVQKQLKGRSGSAGAFTMGSLLGLAAAPCGTALIAYFITEVAKDGRLQFGIPIFVSMGLGLGLPYVFLAAVGAQLPRSADWLVSIKKILGVIVILLAFDRFLVPALTGYGVSTEIALGINVTAFLLGAAYLGFYDRSFSSKIVAGIRTLTVIGSTVYGMMLFTDLQNLMREKRFEQLEAKLQTQVERKINWIPFTIQKFEQAIGKGKAVVVDGTANWCAACQEIEHKTLSDPRVIVSMRDVVAFRMDASTGVADEFIKATQHHFGWQSLPHIRFYNAQGELIHIQKEFINVEDWLENLKKAGVKIVE